MDEANQCVWWGDRRVELTPKAFLVLRCLMQRPNQIVSKNELLDAGWADAHVTEGVLKVAINQLREALGDESQQPRFIETVHRRGYRWIGSGAPQVSRPDPTAGPAPPDLIHVNDARPFLVGRAAALAQLEQALGRATGGSRQTVFITGDPGIGKSTVMDTFVAHLAAADSATVPLLLAQGQCVDGYGTADPYMPLLHALAQLCRQPTGHEIVELLRRLAPTWLVQLPQLLEAGEQQELRRALAGSSSERMVHDLLCFLEELTARRTLVLLLEDLHWSDNATIGALAALAGRRERAHLMIVASYRPVDAIAHLHPIIRLRHELTAKRQCQEIALEGLTVEAIDAFLAARFSQHRLPVELPALLLEQTYGNPLFMVNAVDDFVQRDWLRECDGVWECKVDLRTLADAVPEGTREMIGFRLEQLAFPDLELLEAASVIGMVFPTQALAAVLERDPSAVEIDCARLARAGQFLSEGEPVEWTDGRTGVQCAFRHALYRQVLYGRVTPARRQLLHGRFAVALEQGFAPVADAIASQLAHHFERGGHLHRAVAYRRKAASRAASRFAYPQAIEHLRAALDIIRRIPAGAQRDADELVVQGELLTPVYAVVGSASSELQEVIERIDALSAAGGPMTVELFRALATLVSVLATGGDMAAARRVSEQLVERSGGELLEIIAGGILGFCELMQGELEAGTTRLERSGGLPEMPGPLDPGIVAASDASLGRLLLGHPVRATKQLALAMQRAAAAKHPATLVHVALGGIRNGAIALDDALVEECVSLLGSLAIQFQERWLAFSQLGTGWLEIRRGDPAGAERIRLARQKLFAVGMRGYQAWFAAMDAAGRRSAGRHEEGAALLDEALALVRRSGECWCEAELHRLRAEMQLGRLTAQRRGTKRWQEVARDAEDDLRRAMEIARSHGAKWWELRAAVTLARLLDACGRRGEARGALSQAYAAWDEGLDLPDLRSAQDLLKALDG